MFSEGGNDYFITDTIKGSALRVRMEKLGKQRMNVDEAFKLLIKVLKIVESLHKRQIKHGNITLDSVKVLKRHSKLDIRLFDF